MADLELQKVGKAGLADIEFAAAAGGGDTVPAGIVAGNWGMRVLLLVSNGGESAVDVTVAGLPAIEVGNGDTGAIPVNAGVYDKRIDVEYSDVTGVTVAALDLAD